MLDSILQDLKARFGKVVGMVIAGIIIFFLVIFLGKWAWNKAFGTDTSVLKDRIQNQEQVITEITNINQQNADGAKIDREAQAESKDALVAHVIKKAENDKAFDNLILKLDRDYVPPPPKKPVVKAPAKPKTSDTPAASEPSVSEDAVAEAQETLRQQRNAVLLQDTLWDAYAQASKAPA